LLSPIEFCIEKECFKECFYLFVNLANKGGIMTTPQHCPGFEQFKNLQSFTCRCPSCDVEKEIFSDEFDKEHKCDKCGKIIDFNECKYDAGV